MLVGNAGTGDTLPVFLTTSLSMKPKIKTVVGESSSRYHIQDTTTECESRALQCALHSQSLTARRLVFDWIHTKTWQV